MAVTILFVPTLASAKLPLPLPTVTLSPLTLPEMLSLPVPSVSEVLEV